MKPPNHGRLARVTTIDEGYEAKFEGYLALDPNPARHVREETGLVLVMGANPYNVLPVYTSDRIEVVR